MKICLRFIGFLFIRFYKKKKNGLTSDELEERVKQLEADKLRLESECKIQKENTEEVRRFFADKNDQVILIYLFCAMLLFDKLWGFSYWHFNTCERKRTSVSRSSDKRLLPCRYFVSVLLKNNHHQALLFYKRSRRC